MAKVIAIPMESSKIGFGRKISKPDINLLLSITYNKFGEFFILNIKDRFYNNIAVGIKLITGVNLIQGRVALTDKIKSIQLVNSSTNYDLKPSLESFGDYFLLVEFQ